VDQVVPLWLRAPALPGCEAPTNVDLENRMSIFGNILAKIFPPSHPAVAAAQAPAPATPPVAAPTSVSEADSPAHVAAAPTAASQAASAQPPVDVDAVISAMPGAPGLNWKTSIVDLLKVLGLDSGLESRKQLAHELGYTGSTTDSATMNVWLHKEVIAKLAANGGTLPADMRP
jgi:hypothetical protein